LPTVAPQTIILSLFLHVSITISGEILGLIVYNLAIGFPVTS